MVAGVPAVFHIADNELLNQSPSPDPTSGVTWSRWSSAAMTKLRRKLSTLCLGI